MDLLSVCPLRVAAVIRSVDSGLELRSIARVNLFRTADGVLDISPSQPLPHEDDLRALDRYEVESDRMLPPPRRSDRRLMGVLTPDGTFAFRAAREAIALRLPSIRPKLFIQEGGGAREVSFEFVSVAMDPETGIVTMLWCGRGGLGRDEIESRAIVALERPEEVVTWSLLIARTRGLAESSIRQRTRAEWHAEAVQSSLEDDTLTSSDAITGERAFDATLPFVNAPSSRRGSLPEPPPVPAAVAPPVIEPRPKPTEERKSIGEKWIERPTFARAEPSLRKEERPHVEEAPMRARMRGAEEIGTSSEARDDGTALELVWHVEGAVARVRRQPELRRWLTAQKVTTSEARELASVARGAEAAPLGRLAQGLAQSSRAGVLDPPAVVVDGLIELQFDPDALLANLVTAARSIAKPNDGLSRALSSAELVTQGALREASWLYAEPEIAKLNEAIDGAARPETSRMIRSLAERKVLRDKKLIGVSVLGARYFVAHLTSRLGDDHSHAVRVYLPEAISPHWPLMARFPAKLIAEARPQIDDSEKGPVSLVAIAVYRRVTLTGP